MLDHETKKLIRKYINESCQELTSLRNEVINLKKNIFKDIYKIKNGNMNGITEVIYKLAAINYELSNSIYDNICNGNLLATHGLLRWQLILWQKAFVLFNDQISYQKWSGNKEIKESDLRKFIRSFKILNSPKIISNNLYVLTLDDDWIDFNNLSALLHIKKDSFESLYQLSTLTEINSFVKHFIKRLLFAEIRNTARFLAVAIHLLDSIKNRKMKKDDPINIQIDSIDDRLYKLRKDLNKSEKEMRWLD